MMTTNRNEQSVFETMIQEEVVSMTTRMTPAEAWAGYVGSQTVEEFVSINRQQGITDIDEMTRRYAADLPNLFEDWDPEQHPDIETIANLLAQYIRQEMNA